MKIVRIKLAEIKDSVYQPRSQADLELENLVQSILKNGLIAPIVLRATGKDAYKKVCGSRRYDALHVIETNIHPPTLPPGAAEMGADGKVVVECVVLPSTINKEDASIDALVENIERLNLTPLERARCYRDMIENLKISKKKLAERLNVDPALITRLTAILDLPKEIRDALDNRLISYKHALIILKLKDTKRQMQLFRRIVRDDLSLADAEFWCARLLNDDEMTPAEKRFDDLEERLMKNDTLNTWINDKRLRMVKSRQGERITLNVESVEEFGNVIREIYKSITP